MDAEVLLLPLALIGVALAAPISWPGAFGGGSVVHQVDVPAGAVPPGPAVATVSPHRPGGLVHSLRFEMPAEGGADLRLWFGWDVVSGFSDQDVPVVVRSEATGQEWTTGVDLQAWHEDPGAVPAGPQFMGTSEQLTAFLYGVMLLSVSTPVAALGLLLGAIDVPTLAGLYLTQAPAGCALACTGVAASTLFGRTWTAAVVAIGLVFATAAFTALVAASGMAIDSQLLDLDLEWAYHWTWYFNPGYGVFLFFAGDSIPRAFVDWVGHYAAASLVTASTAVFAIVRVRGMRD